MGSDAGRSDCCLSHNVYRPTGHSLKPLHGRGIRGQQTWRYSNCPLAKCHPDLGSAAKMTVEGEVTPLLLRDGPEAETGNFQSFCGKVLNEVFWRPDVCWDPGLFGGTIFGEPRVDRKVQWIMYLSPA